MEDNFYLSRNKKYEFDQKHYESFRDQIPEKLSQIEIDTGLLAFNKYSIKDYVQYFDGFYSDLYKFNLLCDTLLSNSENNQISYNRHLDIGCREGFVGRMLKGSSLVNETHGIDIYDFSQNFLKDFKLLYKLLSKFNLDFKNTYSKTQSIIGKIIKKLKFYKSIDSLDLFRQLSLQDYKLNPKDKKFDLITCIATICYLNPYKFVDKILSLSEIGTEVYIYSDNFMFPVNSSKVVTKIPFSIQRFSKDEFPIMLDKVHSDENNHIKSLNDYYMDGNPVSAKRLCELLEQKKFKIISLEYSKKVDWAEDLLNQNKEIIFEDITTLHGDLEIRDLTSRFYWIHAKRI